MATMDGVKTTASPFADAGTTPIQRNPPLAPSQELAYRNKCIQLKKRLSEIESNNDNIRRRIAAEKERVMKQRLLRSLLVHQLREIMETPGRNYTAEELDKMGIVITEADEDRRRPDGEMLLDDSSENSDEDVPEVSRPITVVSDTQDQERSKRSKELMLTTSSA